jgi:acyl-CoA dehydrogenase
MAIFFELILIIVLTGVLSAKRAPGWLWGGCVVAYLALWPAWHATTAWVLAPAWLILVPPILLLAIPPLRRNIVTAPVMRSFKKIMPPVSQTEREALDAGTVWWEAELFSGAPDWNKLLAIPCPALTAEEQAYLDGPVSTLCEMLDDWDITQHRHDLPEDVWSFIKKQGFFGMIIPKRYGGLEFSAYAHSCVVMKIASRSISAAVTVMVPNSLGPGQLLMHYGTEAQKNHYLPRLARGEEIPCFALTGPEAGSDAASMPDRGVVCTREIDGKQELGILLNWDKRYITLGPVATLLGVAFKLYDPEGLLGGDEELGITLALIPTDTPGVEIGERHFPLSQAFMNGPNRGVDVFITMDHIIGGRERLGQGWRMLMECLADGRSISLPALSTGAAKLAARATGAYASVRKQFKTPIATFEGITEVLARIGANAYLMDAARCLTLAALEQGEKPSVASAIVKYHLTERMRRVVDDAMDVHGGRGICMGPRNYLARAYQAIPISITVEGANILTRSLIIFGQGAIRCHPYLLKEMNSAAGGRLADFDAAFFGHIKSVFSNLVRGVLHGWTGARFAHSPVDHTEGRYYRHLTRLSASYAIVSEAALTMLGGELKRRESISARLGDVLSNLYIASATLKRFNDQGRLQADAPLLDWSMAHLLFCIQESLVDVLQNLPGKTIARVLRAALFPFGLPFKKPDDDLTRRAAALTTRWGTARERLSEGIYLPKQRQEPLAELEDAMEKTALAQPILKRVRDAMKNDDIERGDPEQHLVEAVHAGIIDEHEAEQVHAAVAARLSVIAVDRFPPDYFQERNDSWHQSETRLRKVEPSA